MLVALQRSMNCQHLFAQRARHTLNARPVMRLDGWRWIDKSDEADNSFHSFAAQRRHSAGARFTRDRLQWLVGRRFSALHTGSTVNEQEFAGLAHNQSMPDATRYDRGFSSLKRNAALTIGFIENQIDCA
jgi:hypothetical protein